MHSLYLADVQEGFDGNIPHWDAISASNQALVVVKQRDLGPGTSDEGVAVVLGGGATTGLQLRHDAKVRLRRTPVGQAGKKLYLSPYI